MSDNQEDICYFIADVNKKAAIAGSLFPNKVVNWLFYFVCDFNCIIF
jgi:hypothetical protein